MLHSNPSSISIDRLKCVKAKARFKNSDVIKGDEIGLFEDVALDIKDKGKRTELKIARIIRMRNKAYTTSELERAVSLKHIDKYPKLQILVST